jgi:hypothetical protein
MANGDGNGWSTVKVFTVILAINAALLPVTISLIMSITSNYGRKFDALADLLVDHEKRLILLEDRVLTKNEKADLLSLIRRPGPDAR